MVHIMEKAVADEIILLKNGQLIFSATPKLALNSGIFLENIGSMKPG
jgi:ABC-type Na+ transport system ATPase subunit NatA